MRVADIEFRAGFLKRRADLAEAGIVEILDDQNPHAISPA